ncbi:hypothetical protein GCM10027048_17920 [Hymenobacter coalescens]
MRNKEMDFSKPSWPGIIAVIFGLIFVIYNSYPNLLFAIDYKTSIAKVLDKRGEQLVFEYTNAYDNKDYQLIRELPNTRLDALPKPGGNIKVKSVLGFCYGSPV